MKRLIIAALGAVALLAATADDGLWTGLTDDRHYAGPKISEADLVGKVVLVDCWGVNCPPCRALLPRMEQIWQSFKAKPFMLIGSHCQGKSPAEVKALVDKNKLTYPIYEYVKYAKEPRFSGLPFMYVVNHRGKLVYSGNDERAATEALVTAIGNVGLPPTLTPDVVFRRYKALEKKFRLGNAIKSDVKKLESDVKSLGKVKKPTAPQKAQLDEAREILAALKTGMADAQAEIALLKRSKPAEAAKYMQLFMKTFPEEGEAYKEQLAEIKAKLDEAKKAK